MSTTAIPMTGPEALELVSGAPEIESKTADDLRQAAKDFDDMGSRKDRLVIADARGRQRARSLSREREGDKLHLQAQVARLAAEEIDNLGCTTVGEAVQKLRGGVIKRVLAKLRGQS